MSISIFGTQIHLFGKQRPFQGNIRDHYREADQTRREDYGGENQTGRKDNSSSVKSDSCAEDWNPKNVQALYKEPLAQINGGRKAPGTLATALKVCAIVGVFFVCVAAVLGVAYLSQHGGIGPNLQIAFDHVKSGVQAGCHWVSSSGIKLESFLQGKLNILTQFARRV